MRRSADGVLVVSPDALSRPWVQEEYAALLRLAVEQPGGRLIPVLYADAELPVFLANRVWVDFRAAATGPAYEERLAELVRYLRGRPAADPPARDGTVYPPTGRGGERVRPGGALRAVLSVSASEVSLAAGVSLATGEERSVSVRPGCGGRRWMRPGCWRSLDTFERLGNQVGMPPATAQLGILEKERGGPVTAAVTWHVKALGIRLRLGVPEAGIDLRRLAAFRRELGAEMFASLLTQTTHDAESGETITSLLDQVDKADYGTA